MTRLACLLAAAILLPGPGPVGGAAAVAQGARAVDALARPAASTPASRPPAAAGEPDATVRLPSGRYTPAFAAPGAPPVRVHAFTLEAHPVTVGEYLVFVAEHPEWRRSAAPAVAAGPGYLASWRDDLTPDDDGAGLDRPVTGVSWFAAAAYCRDRGGRLPTTDEWEYAASSAAGGRPGPAPDPGEAGALPAPDAASPPDFTAALRAVHGMRASRAHLPRVGATWVSDHGVWDLHGIVWEWTADFNSRLATGAGRDDQGLDRQLFCAAGSTGATDRTDYVAFLRFAFRTSLSGADAGPELGFRCAY